MKPASFVVVSVFVNPKQFGPNEDFAKRSADGRRRPCVLRAGREPDLRPECATRCIPRAAVTFVDVAKLGDVLCGASRPGHFRGVCTVVLVLFNIVQPDARTSSQRLAAGHNHQTDGARSRCAGADRGGADGARRTARDEFANVIFHRNERAAAPMIYSALLSIRFLASNGQRDAASLQETLQELLAAIPGARVDYARVVDAETLEPLEKLHRPAVAAVAVFLGTTRLIDNISLS
ncbi:MAG: pantoate--beta-alanine ligase [Gemmataceae bacterium]